MTPEEEFSAKIAAKYAKDKAARMAAMNPRAIDNEPRVPVQGVPVGVGIEPDDEFGKALAGQPAVVSPPGSTGVSVSQGNDIQPILDRMNSGEYVPPPQGGQVMASVTPPQPEVAQPAAQPAGQLSPEKMEVAALLEGATGPGGKPSRSKLLATGMFIEMPDGRLRYRKPVAPQPQAPATTETGRVVPPVVPGSEYYVKGAKPPTPTKADSPPETRNIAGVNYTEQPSNMVDPITGNKYFPPNSPEKKADKLAEAKLQKLQSESDAAKESILSGAKDQLTLIDELINHPERSAATGKSGVTNSLYLPGTPRKEYVAKLKRLGNLKFMEGFSKLKGGGSITEREGQAAKDALMNVNLDLTEEEFLKQLGVAKATMQSLVKKIEGGTFKATEADIDSTPPAAEAFGLKIPPVK